MCLSELRPCQSQLASYTSAQNRGRSNDQIQAKEVQQQIHGGIQEMSAPARGAVAAKRESSGLNLGAWVDASSWSHAGGFHPCC